MVSAAKRFYARHKKYAPALYFVIGFIWDSLTLERIDHFYSNFVLAGHLICLMISLYIFNLADDGRWKHTFLEDYEEYAPLAIQFFLGSLASAYIVFFFRSVSFSRTIVFLILLVFLYIANEVFKHRISNKYLQFGAFFFVAFTYFEFIIPVFAGTMSTHLFIIAGLVALGLTLFFVTFIYGKSPSTRREISLFKLTAVILVLYAAINVLYYLNMIPPVPLTLKTGIIAYRVEKTDQNYRVTYDTDKSYKIWRTFNPVVYFEPGDTVFAYTSIFAPTDLKKSVAHRWKHYNTGERKWEISDTLSYQVEGGRGGGYRGYTFKTNLEPGAWKIDVVTKEGLILGTIGFKLRRDSSFTGQNFVTKEFK